MLKDIIRKLREAHHLTQEEVARYLHIQRTTYTRYETGTNTLNFQSLCKLADLYKVTTDFLLERNSSDAEDIDLELTALYRDSDPVFQEIVLDILRKGQKFKPHPPLQKACIPLFRGNIVGLPLEAPDAQEAYVKSGDYAVAVQDDSMLKAGICAGDYAVIRPSSNLSDGEIMLVHIGDHSVLRRISEKGDKIILETANPAYESLSFSKYDLDDICFLGRMIKIIKSRPVDVQHEN